LDVEPKEDKPTILLTRRKRGQKKKTLSRKELELRAMTPRMRDLAEGRLSIDDLDWEELTKGMLRDKNGNFTGAKPAMLPREWHEKMAAEILKGAEAQFRKNYQLTMDTLVKMVESERTPAREKLAAIIYMQERTIGKVTEKREVKTEVTVFDTMVQNGEFLMDLGEIETGETDE
jgi:hypothetical protein